jgi:hypothetical protein
VSRRSRTSRISASLALIQGVVCRVQICCGGEVYKCRYGELVDTLRQMLGRVGLMMLAAGDTDSEVTKRERALRHNDFSLLTVCQYVVRRRGCCRILGPCASAPAPSSLASHRDHNQRVTSAYDPGCLLAECRGHSS